MCLKRSTVRTQGVVSQHLLAGDDGLSVSEKFVPVQLLMDEELALVFAHV